MECSKQILIYVLFEKSINSILQIVHMFFWILLSRLFNPIMVNIVTFNFISMWFLFSKCKPHLTRSNYFKVCNTTRIHPCYLSIYSYRCKRNKGVHRRGTLLGGCFSGAPMWNLSYDWCWNRKCSSAQK